MRLDTQTMFSDKQELTGSSLVGAKVIDNSFNGFAEAECFVAVRAQTALVGLTSVELQGSANNSEWAVLTSAAVKDLTEGAGVNMRVPQGCPRYLRLVYKGASMSGTVTAGVTLCAGSPRGARIGDYEAQV